MTTLKTRIMPLALSLAAFWSSGSHALIIDSFETDASAAAVCAAVCGDSVFTADSGAGMLGDRTIDILKTVGPTGGANGAYADVSGGFLAMANGPVTLSTMTLTWDFAATDLTTGGSTGFYFSLPAPIDNDLTVGVTVNGGPEYTNVYPDGSIGNSFYIAYTNLANSGDVTAATQVTLSFQNGAAWDATFDFIGTSPEETPAPATLALFGLGLAGLGWSRRKKRS